MDLVQFFEDVAKNFNEEQRCNSCWKVYAPLAESGLSSINPEEKDKCCNALILTSIAQNYGYESSRDTGLVNNQTCDTTFTLYAVKAVDSLGINVYNEQGGHPTSESLYITHIRPLQECLGCGNEIDLCEIGYDFDIIRWNMEVVAYKEDFNWSGWKITGVFRHNIVR